MEIEDFEYHKEKEGWRIYNNIRQQYCCIFAGWVAHPYPGVPDYPTWTKHYPTEQAARNEIDLILFIGWDDCKKR